MLIYFILFKLTKKIVLINKLVNEICTPFLLSNLSRHSHVTIFFSFDSFVSLFPTHHPRYCILVIILSSFPQNNHTNIVFFFLTSYLLSHCQIPNYKLFMFFFYSILYNQFGFEVYKQYIKLTKKKFTKKKKKKIYQQNLLMCKNKIVVIK